MSFESDSETKGLNLPIAGFIAAARTAPDIELVPVLWCAAEPSAHVTDSAFDTITAEILDVSDTAMTTMERKSCAEFASM